MAVSDSRKSFGNKDFAKTDAFSFADPNSAHPTLRYQSIETLIKDENRFKIQERDKSPNSDVFQQFSPIEPRTPIDVRSVYSGTKTPQQDHTKINPILISGGRSDFSNISSIPITKDFKSTSGDQLRDLIAGTHTPEPIRLNELPNLESKSLISFDSTHRHDKRLLTDEHKNQTGTIADGSRLDRSGFRSQNLSRMGLDKSSLEEQLESSFSKAYVSRKNRILGEVPDFNERMDSDIYYRRKFHNE